MKTIKFLIFTVSTLLFLGCNDEKKESEMDDYESETMVEKEEPHYYEEGVLTVVTEAMDFQTSDTINSGWNKIVYKNMSPEVHFIMLDIYPEGKTEDTIKARIVPPFDEGMAYLMEGKTDSAMAAFGKLPPWFGEVRFVGGTGLISPQSTAVSMINFEPGNYIMECYVKMADGTFHVSHGMYKHIYVREEATNIVPPQTQNKITVSSTEGIAMSDTPSSGKATFEVHFKDQKPYEHFLGHDVNLVKYDNGISTDSLIPWMNWMLPDGLKTPPPSGFTFLGGVNNLEPGRTGYFEVDLSPGNYVLISEVPDAKKKGLYKEFKVE